MYLDNISSLKIKFGDLILLIRNLTGKKSYYDGRYLFKIHKQYYYMTKISHNITKNKNVRKENQK